VCAPAGAGDEALEGGRSGCGPIKETPFTTEPAMFKFAVASFVFVGIVASSHAGLPQMGKPQQAKNGVPAKGPIVNPKDLLDRLKQDQRKQPQQDQKKHDPKQHDPRKQDPKQQDQKQQDQDKQKKGQLPDLVVTEITNALHLQVKGSVVTVKNAGVGPSAKECRVEMNLISTKPGEEGKILGSYAGLLPPLQPGQTRQVVIPVLDPLPEGGKWTIRATVDTRKEIAESNEQNNTLTLR
jgi:hypothetical protein